MVHDKPTDDAKLQSLKAQGCLNRHPEAVTDEPFASEFFDPRDLVQVKYEMLRRVRHDGQPVSRASAAFGLSRPSYYQAQTAYEREGCRGYCPRSADRARAQADRGGGRVRRSGADKGQLHGRLPN